MCDCLYCQLLGPWPYRLAEVCYWAKVTSSGKDLQRMDGSIRKGY